MNALRSALRNGRRLSQDLVGLSRVLRLSDTVRYGAAVAASLPQVVRSRKLVAADEKMRGRDFQLRVARAKVVLGGEDFGGIREMYGRSVYFAEPHCSFPSNGWAIDLGANAGLFTLAAACSGLRVVSVEAQPGFIPEIRRRLNRNNVAEDSVVILCGLVGPGSGVLAGEGWKSASHAGTTPPSALEIGAVMAPLAGDRVGFLKMDIEGSEFDLLGANPDWLDRVDRIAAEIHSRFGSPSTIVQLLRERGFATAWKDGDLRPAIRETGDGYLYAWRRDIKGQE